MNTSRLKNITRKHLRSTQKLATEIEKRHAMRLNPGAVLRYLGEYVKAKKYLEKALAINFEIGDREGEAKTYGNLGTALIYLGEYIKA